MDFADFDLATAAEVGTWHHFEMNGSPLYRQEDNSISATETDKPCRVLLKGIGSDATMAILKEITRVEQAHQFRLQRSKDNEIEGLIIKLEEKSEGALKRLILASVSSWENIVIGGKDAECNAENKLKVCGPKTAFFAQTYQRVLERHDFLKDAAKN